MPEQLDERPPTDGPAGSAGPSVQQAKAAPAWVWPVRVIGLLLVLLATLAAAMLAVERFARREAVQRFDVGAVQRLVLDGDTGRVTVGVDPAAARVRVVQTLTSSFDTARVDRTVRDGALRLVASCSGPWLNGGSCRSEFAVTVPPGTALRLQTDTGRIGVDGADGDLTVASSTGALTLENLSSPTVGARSSTGAVQVGFSTAPQQVSAESSTGAVTVAVPADGTEYRVSAESDTGAVRIEVPRNAASARRIDVTSSTGAVRVRTASG